MKNNDVIGRLEGALLETKMMNQLFIDQIKSGEVSAEYVSAALQNFRDAMNPRPLKVKDRYVLGFVFNPDLSRVLLVMKNRPAWQNGKLNGVGGKVEPGETSLDAMEREFVEETYFKSLMTCAAPAALYHEPEYEELEWIYVGERFRPSIFSDSENGSYSMSVYGAIFSDVRHLVIESAFSQMSEKIAQWSIPEVQDPRRETVIALPLNREILARRGVPGLAGIVDLTIQSLREGFTFSIEDAHTNEHIEA